MWVIQCGLKQNQVYRKALYLSTREKPMASPLLLLACHFGAMLISESHK